MEKQETDKVDDAVEETAKKHSENIRKDTSVEGNVVEETEERPEEKVMHNILDEEEQISVEENTKKTFDCLKVYEKLDTDDKDPNIVTENVKETSIGVDLGKENNHI